MSYAATLKYIGTYILLSVLNVFPPNKRGPMVLPVQLTCKPGGGEEYRQVEKVVGSLFAAHMHHVTKAVTNLLT